MDLSLTDSAHRAEVYQPIPVVSRAAVTDISRAASKCYWSRTAWSGKENSRSSVLSMP